MRVTKMNSITVRTRIQRAAAMMSLAAVTAGIVMTGPNALAGVRTNGPKPIAFTHVNVVPMNVNSLMVDETVIVLGDRIVKMGAAASTRIPVDATVIDADGEYLMPQPANATKNQPQAPSAELVQQLQKYVAAGHTAYQALATVTIDAAKAQNKTDDAGSVQKGRVANLLLLTANPLMDVENVTHVGGVMVSGLWMPQSQTQAAAFAVESERYYRRDVVYAGDVRTADVALRTAQPAM